MASRFVLPEASFTSWNSQRATLTQEGIRRLHNTSSTLPKEESLNILNKFSRKILASGYSVRQVREIILSSLKGFSKKVSGGGELRQQD